MKRVYWVTSPEYSVYIDYFPEFGSGPRADIRDWKEVEASSKREAVSIAVKGWLAEGKERYSHDDYYVVQQRQDGLCPFTGVRAEVAACPHGVEMPLGFKDDFWCERCENEFEAKIKAELVG